MKPATGHGCTSGGGGRRILLGCLLAVGLLLGSAVVRPQKLLEWTLQKVYRDPAARVQAAYWSGWDELTLAGVSLPKQAVFADTLQLRLHPAALLRGQWQEFVEAVEVSRPVVRFNLAEVRAKMEVPAPEAAQSPLAALQGARLPDIKIQGGQLVLEGLGPAIRAMALPMEFELTQLPGKEGEEPVWRAHLGQFQVHSPFDPLAPVFAWESLDMEFTLPGLARQRLERVVLTAPVLFVGPDLFWVIDFVRNQTKKAAPPTEKMPWTVGRFQVRAGMITLTPAGQPALQLPLVFEAEQEELVVSSLEELRIKSAVRIPMVTLDYPEYQLHLGKLKGTLEFSLPRGDASANNLVNLVSMEEVRWRQLAAQQLWGSATFDAQGLYLSFGAKAYEGYLSGNVTLRFQDMGWKAGFGFSAWDVSQFSRVLRPEVIQMSGKATLRGVLQGSGKSLLAAEAKGRFLAGGKMKIVAMDTFQKNMPTDMSLLKQDMLRIVLQALRDYDFTSASVDARHVPEKSTLKLELDGADGSRNLRFNFNHPPPPPLSKQP